MSASSLRLISLREEREAAEQTLATATHAVNTLRTQLITAEILTVFPEATMVVFGRNWDESQPKLVQILTETEEFDFDDEDFWDALSKEQCAGLASVLRLVRLYGDDQTLWNYMEPASVSSNDGVEFRLALTESAVSNA